MAKKPRKPSEQASKLGEALQFLSLVTSKTGTPYQTHIKLISKWAVAFNEIIAAGQPIEEDITACPHAETLNEALKKCGASFEVSQPDQHRLVFKNAKFRANVPCIDPNLLFIGSIDGKDFDINQSFVDALTAINVMPYDEGGDKVYPKSILMWGPSIIACDGAMVLEYWHGLDLPVNIAIPKSFITILGKIKKKPVKLGNSQSTLTIHYEDESWIRTQLYKADWPDVRPIFDRKSYPLPVPEGFFQGLASVAPFSTDGSVHFRAGAILSHASEDAGASYAVPGLEAGPIYSAEQLLMCQPFMEHVDFYAKSDHNSLMMMFHNAKCRGALMARAR